MTSKVFNLSAWSAYGIVQIFGKQDDAPWEWGDNLRYTTTPGSITVVVAEESDQFPVEIQVGTCSGLRGMKILECVLEIDERGVEIAHARSAGEQLERGIIGCMIPVPWSGSVCVRVFSSSVDMQSEPPNLPTGLIVCIERMENVGP
ncbi:MAG: hypothetical protein Q4G50_10575 [Corynebacterium sp.]|uniref:hypothetical protein n=1 Tax=Corynebacterium sp. TaxID=1720 RepID=UPI0026DFD94E|nr:hypothetical protein [Corynebacterium sp.]MDO5670439.1 hypothetical protein [Corynebacterium sp.]